MTTKTSRPPNRPVCAPYLGVASVFAVSLAIPGAPALADSSYFLPNNLLVSRVIYDNNPNNVVAGVTQLPPGCAPANCVTATRGTATLLNRILMSPMFVTLG